MSKYSKDIKLTAVQQYLQSNDSPESIAIKLSIDSTSLRKWIRHYEQHGATAFEKKYSQYTAHFKLSVLNYVQRHGCSYKQAAAKFDIRDSSSIANWSRRYQTGGLEALIPKRKGRPSMTPKKSVKKSDSALTREELMKELEYLRAENAFLKKYDALLQEKEEAAKKKRSSSKG